MNIELTEPQARALAGLAQKQGTLVVRQLPEVAGTADGDVYITPRGSAHGYRIDVEGGVTDIGETLPAPD